MKCSLMPLGVGSREEKTGEMGFLEIFALYFYLLLKWCRFNLHFRGVCTA